jgi:hypothetical protein
MKVENMKDGMRVVVKKNATEVAASYVGRIGVLQETFTSSIWRVVVGNGSFAVYPKEVRKVREGDAD